MGACQFEAWVQGIDIKDAFDTEVQQARYECGSGGYTGTIAEKDHFTILTNEILSVSEAEALMRKHFSDDNSPVCDKWGPCGAIPYGKSNAGTIEKKLKFRVDGRPSPTDIMREVDKKFTSVVNTTTTTLKTKYKTVISTTEGDASVKYFVQSNGRAISGLYESQAGARAFMKSVLEEEARTGEPPKGVYNLGQEYRVVGRRVRGASDEGLVVGINEPIHTDVEVVVQIAKETKVPPTQEGWLFFGWASS